MKKPVKVILIVLDVIAILLILAIGSYLILTDHHRFLRVGDTAVCAWNENTNTAVVVGFGKLWDYEPWMVFGHVDYPTHGMIPLTAMGLTVEKAIICNGITNVPGNLFGDCDVTELYIPASVKEMDCTAFIASRDITALHFGGDAPKFVYGGQDTTSDGSKPGNPLLKQLEDHAITIYYPPGAKGWDSPDWEGFQLIEQKYHVDWS